MRVLLFLSTSWFRAVDVPINTNIISTSRKESDVNFSSRPFGFRLGRTPRRDRIFRPLIACTSPTTAPSRLLEPPPAQGRKRKEGSRHLRRPSSPLHRDGYARVTCSSATDEHAPFPMTAPLMGSAGRRILRDRRRGRRIRERAVRGLRGKRGEFGAGRPAAPSR